MIVAENHAIARRQTGMKGTTAALIVAVCCISGAAAAEEEGLFKRLGDAAGDAADAIVDTTKKVGDTVGETISSTEELVSNEPTPEETRAKLDTMADATLQRFFDEIPGGQDLFDRSAGYAVFDTRKVTIFPLSAGYGRGVAVDRETDARTYMQMGSGGVGGAIGIGGFVSQIVILFEYDGLLQDFVTNGYDASAEAQMKVDREVTGDTLYFQDGRSVFVLGTRGWRVAATAGGTRYWPDKALNAGLETGG
jgi:hypothetical protein